MRLRIRRRWLCIAGVVAGLIGVTAVLSWSMDEPARRYMEREINARLTGYRVSVRAVHVHPWSVSVELLDATISQDANPKPPVARIRSLTAGLHWRALIHGKVVADMAFDRPALYVNLKNLRAEAAGDVALKDRGWQRALEAVGTSGPRIASTRPTSGSRVWCSTLGGSRSTAARTSSPSPTRACSRRSGSTKSSSTTSSRSRIVTTCP